MRGITTSGKSKLHANCRRSQGRRRPFFEALEPRTLLSVGTLTAFTQNLNGSIGADVADPVRDVVYVADNGHGNIVAINTDTGTTVGTAHQAANITSLAVSVDDTRLFAAEPGAFQIEVFSLPSMTLLKTLSMGITVPQVAAAANDRLIGMTPSGIEDYNAETGAILYSIPSINAGLIKTNAPGTVLYTRQSVGGSGEDGFLNVWDISGTGAPIAQANIPGPSANSVDYTVDTTLGKAYFMDGGVYGITTVLISNGSSTVWNFVNGAYGQGVAELPGSAYVYGMSYEDIEQFNQSGVVLNTYTLPDGENGASLVITPNGNLVYTFGTGVGIIGLPSLNVTETAPILSVGTLAAAVQNLNGSIGADVADPVRNVAYVADNGNGNIVAINTSTGTTVATAQQAGNVTGLAISADDTRLFAAEPSMSQIQVFSLPTMALLNTLDVGVAVTQVAAGANDRVIGLIGSDIEVFNAETGASLYSMSVTYTNNLIKTNAAGTVLYTRTLMLDGDDGSLTDWDINGTGAPVALPEIPGPTGLNSEDYAVDQTLGKAYFMDGGVYGITVTLLSTGNSTMWSFINGVYGVGVAELQGGGYVYGLSSGLSSSDIEQFNQNGVVLNDYNLPDGDNPASLVITPNGNLIYTFSTGVGIVGISSLNITETTSTTQSKLAFGIGPVGAVGGTTLAPFTVDVENGSGTTVSTDSSTVTLTVAGPYSTIEGTAAVAAHNGVATFTNVALPLSGSYAFIATDGILAGAVSASVNITASPNQQYVTQLYNDLLSRTPDSGGLVYWTVKLDSGAAIQAVAAGIQDSNESNSNVVTSLYENILGRAPDSGGLTYWTNQLDAGTSVNSIRNGFFASNEYYADQGGTDADWIDAVYQYYLGRAPDSGGLFYWEGVLAAGGASVSDINPTRLSAANYIGTSQEYYNDVVSNAYEKYLLAAPDSGGLSYWSNALYTNALTVNQFTVDLVTSAQYFTAHGLTPI